MHNGAKYICSCHLKGLLILQLVFCCIVSRFCWLFFVLQHFAVENKVHAQDYPFRNLVSFLESLTLGRLRQVSFLFHNTQLK